MSEATTIELKVVDEHKEFTFKNLCPYCKAHLTYVAEGWIADDDGQWMADSFDVQCHSEPDMENEQEWEEWLSIHSDMLYVNQMPVDIQVKKWINERYRFKLEI